MAQRLQKHSLTATAMHRATLMASPKVMPMLMATHSATAKLRESQMANPMAMAKLTARD